MNRKPFFDAVRRLLGRGFTNAEVAALDEVLDSALRPDAPSAPETAAVPREIGARGLKLIREFEGCRLDAYRCPANRWTIGWGATRIDGRPVRPGDRITQAKADALLVEQLRGYSAEVRSALGSALAGTSQLQFDALVSFHYNTGAIGRATLTRLHRAGKFADAAAEFGRWNRADGKVMPGLTRRRAAEAAIYREGSR